MFLGTKYTGYLKIAQGSLYEMGTQLYLCEALEYLDHDSAAQALSRSAEIGKMLNTALPRLNGQTYPYIATPRNGGLRWML
jgi:four helix bundle protein